MPDAPRPTLRRTLGIPDGVALLVGIAIGAGIYSTPQLIATYASSFYAILALWIGAGVFAFVGGLIYAELGTRLPHTGGEYVYLSRGFGPFAGFMFGWAQLFIIRTSPAAGLALITADYLGHFVPLTGFAHTAAALAVIAGLGAVNYVGVQWASLYQKISTLLKVGGLLVLVVLALAVSAGQDGLLATTAPPTASLGPVGNTVAALMLVLFTYLGWDRVGYVAGEMKNPRRVVPASLLLGVGLVVILYVGANVAYYRTLGIEGLRGSTVVATDMMEVLLGPGGAGFIALLVIISATGSTNGTIMSASRVYYAMARDGLFFRRLDYVHPRYRTPSRAIVAHCVWGAVILLVRGSFETIVAGMVFAILIFYGFVTLTLFRFRRDGVGGDDVYRVPFYPWLPGLYLAGIVVLVALRAFYEWEKSLVDLAFVLTGLPFALIWVRRVRRLPVPSDEDNGASDEDNGASDEANGGAS